MYQESCQSISFMAMMQVCAACHSVQQLHFRNLVDVAYTEEEAKTMAADIEVTLGIALGACVFSDTIAVVSHRLPHLLCSLCQPCGAEFREDIRAPE
jgi:cytochrome c1